MEVTLESSSLAAIAAEALVREPAVETTVPDPTAEPLPNDASPAAPDRPARRATAEHTASSGPEHQAVPEAPRASPAPLMGHAALAPRSGHVTDGLSAGCTAPQLRRFIKSRAYVPMHELRRRFGIDGVDDDVTGVEIERGNHVYVGLPGREGHLLGELFRAGDVGYELSLDPISPIVVGVFPMRPIARG